MHSLRTFYVFIICNYHLIINKISREVRLIKVSHFKFINSFYDANKNKHWRFQLHIFNCYQPWRCFAPKSYLSLHCDDEELHREAQDVPRVKAVPNGQKEQRWHVRQCLIAQKLQPLEYVPLKKKSKFYISSWPWIWIKQPETLSGSPLTVACTNVPASRCCMATVMQVFSFSVLKNV